MERGRIEHPADFRADARLGRWTLLQLLSAVILVVSSGMGAIIMMMFRADGWKIALVVAVAWSITAEILFGLRRQLARATRWAFRARWRRADASRPGAVAKDETVQDLFPVHAVSGPFLSLPDGQLAMVLRIQPPPTQCLSEIQREVLRGRFQAALRRAAQRQVEVALYTEVIPDLDRPQHERLLHLAHRLPAESGLRHIAQARLQHHAQFAQEVGHVTVHHMRLSVSPQHVVTGAGNQAESMMDHLREVGMAIAEELRVSGQRVQFLAPEALRDLAARQLDPHGWRQTEPPRGTDWAWPVGDERRTITGNPADLVPPEVMATATPTPAVVTEELAPPPLPPIVETPPAIEMVEESPVVEEIPPPPPLPWEEPMTERDAEPTPPPEPEPTPPALPPMPAPEPEPVQVPNVPTPSRAPDRSTAAPGAHPLQSREVLAVIGADRKTGTSSVAISIALAIRARGNSTTVISMDGGRNDLVAWAGMDAIVSVMDWAHAAAELMLPGPRGITLIPGPTRLAGATYQPMAAELVGRLLGQARREADVLVLDLGAAPEATPEHRAALAQATAMLVVATPDTDHTRIATVVQMAQAQGLHHESVALAINRVTDPHSIRGAELILPEDPALASCRRMRSYPVIGAPTAPWTQALVAWVHTLR